MKPMLFCNIGWMKYYRGLLDDSIQGGGEFVEKNGVGGEMFNFTERPGGMVHGYVEALGNNININKLGAKATDDFVENSLVIWVSKKPQLGGVFIVGWYNDAAYIENSRSWNCSMRDWDDWVTMRKPKPDMRFFYRKSGGNLRYPLDLVGSVSHISGTHKTLSINSSATM